MQNTFKRNVNNKLHLDPHQYFMDLCVTSGGMGLSGSQSTAQGPQRGGIRKGRSRKTLAYRTRSDDLGFSGASFYKGAT